MNFKLTATNYFSLSDQKKKNFLEEAYLTKEMSWISIAKLVGTYANKVRRDALKLGISSRDKGDAQKKALRHGRSQHPTEGNFRTLETKNEDQRNTGCCVG